MFLRDTEEERCGAKDVGEMDWKEWGMGNCCRMYVCENNTKEKKNMKGDKDKLILWYWWMYEFIKANIEATSFIGSYFFYIIYIICFLLLLGKVVNVTILRFNSQSSVREQNLVGP